MSMMSAERIKTILRHIAPPRHIRFILCATMVGLVLFSLIRIALLLNNLDLVNVGVASSLSTLLKALYWGVRFDISFTTKLLLLPLAVIGVGAVVGRFNRWFGAVATWCTVVLMSVALMLDIVDIPFYDYTHFHINPTLVLGYLSTDASQAFNLIVGEGSYIACAIVVCVVVVLYGLFTLRIARHYGLYEPRNDSRLRTIIYVVLLGGLIPFTVRGMSFNVRPLKGFEAAISDNGFINTLGINPVEPFVAGLISNYNRIFPMMDSAEAYAYVRNELGSDEHLVKRVDAKPSPWKNVVIIVQEGNSAERLQREGDDKALLSNLDRLIRQGLYFENAYSTSTQTSYGIYGLVTSMPPYLDLHPLKDGLQHPLNTIFEQLSERDAISTIFFVPHDHNFDNVTSFLRMQGFERVVSRLDYGVETDDIWGVDDHVMFDYALQQIDDEQRQGNSVVAVLLTCTNHAPFNPPVVDGFTPKAADDEERAIEYGDWAMNRFLEMASTKEWFDETLFVITSDHGRFVREDYVMSESIFHIPVLFYSPKHIASEVRSDIVAQADIVPTAISMLGKEYYNRAMGIDLTTESREYVVYSSANYFACRSRKWLYVHSPTSNTDTLYDLEAEGDARLRNVAREHPDVVERMCYHARATIQAGWDIHNDIEQTQISKQ